MPRLTLRHLLAAVAAVAASLFAACANGPVPPPQLYRLDLAAPADAPAPTPAPAAAPAWQLALPVAVPEYLDRDALVRARGAQLELLAGHRWAEPLRDAVPRVLRADLARWRGAPVWGSPLPPGADVARVLRVELLALDLRPDGALQLRAQWSLADPRGAVPPLQRHVDLSVPVGGNDAGALVAAHRLALWRLAERIAAQEP